MLDAAAVLEVAGRAFDWIESAAVPGEGGSVAWSEGGVVSDDLYAGTAGVLLACAEACVSGLDVRRVGEAARDRLVRLAELDAGVPDDSLFSGWTGLALALRSWSQATGDGRAGAAAAELGRRIAGRITGSPADPARYLDVISGDAGVLLGLLGDAGSDVDAALDVLVDGLADAAETADGRVHWPMVPGYQYLMPGFSHGTAGVAYALAAAGARLHRPAAVRLAVQAGHDLIALGQHVEGWGLPLMLPRYPNRPAVYYGWCHGAAGTVRLFLILAEVDGAPAWSAAADSCLDALRAARLPVRRYPGFWDNVSCCCGTAGIGRLLLDRFEATGDRRFLDESARYAADVLARRQESARGVAWSNTEHTADPPDLPPEAGLMQGGAAIASWLARLAALASGRRPVRLDPRWI